MRGGQLLVHGLADIGFGQARPQAAAHRLADALAGRVLLPDPADHGGVRGDFHAARGVFAEHPIPLQVGVGAGHHLGIGQQPLGKGQILRQGRPGFEGPRRDLGNDLAGDLLMDRYGGVGLDIDHGSFEGIAGGGGMQAPGGRDETGP